MKIFNVDQIILFQGYKWKIIDIGKLYNDKNYWVYTLSRSDWKTDKQITKKAFGIDLEKMAV